MMLQLALSLVVSTSSGGLLSGYETKHVRLIDAVEVVGGVVLGQQPPQAGQSLEGLKQQVAQLQEDMPDFTVPIVLAASGVGVVITLSVLWSVMYFSPVAALITVILFIAAVAVGIVGGVMIGTTAGRRGRMNREIRRLNQQIEQLQSGGGAPQPGYQPLPSGPTPPPPPPPSSQLTGPEAGTLVAEF